MVGLDEWTLSIDDVAAKLRCHRTTVRRIPKDQLPYRYSGGKGRRRWYRPIDVDRYTERLDVA
jgi:hypothetical protein